MLNITLSLVDIVQPMLRRRSNAKFRSWGRREPQQSATSHTSISLLISSNAVCSIHMCVYSKFLIHYTFNNTLLLASTPHRTTVLSFSPKISFIFSAIGGTIMLNLVFGTTVQACFISSSQTVAPSFFGYCSVTKSGTLNILPAVIY